MQLPFCALLAWITIIIASLIPKRLSTLDIIFLYCVTLIMTTTMYTSWDINLRISTIDKTPKISFAIIICRMITIPVLVLMAVNVLQGKKRLWSVAFTCWLVLIGFDVLLYKMGLIKVNNLLTHELLSSVTNLFFIFFNWVVVLWFKKDDRKDETSP